MRPLQMFLCRLHEDEVPSDLTAAIFKSLAVYRELPFYSDALAKSVPAKVLQLQGNSWKRLQQVSDNSDNLPSCGRDSDEYFRCSQKATCMLYKYVLGWPLETRPCSLPPLVKWAHGVADTVLTYKDLPLLQDSYRLCWSTCKAENGQ